MSTLFPAGLDAFTTKVDSVDDVLAADTNNLQDAVSALQEKVGVDGSSVPSSLDKRLADVEALPKSIGGPQTWQNMRSPTVLRTTSTAYQNLSGRPIQLSITWVGWTNYLQVSSDGTTWSSIAAGAENANDRGNSSPIIPEGWYYRLTGGTIYFWQELR